MTRTNRLVTIFGGSGFLGRYVARELARRGWRIRIATRRPDLAFHTQPSGRVGQINAVQANLRYPESILPALQNADAVVNLVAILREQGGQSFDAVNHLGARAVAEAVRAAGIESFVHVSALGADPESPSHYARSKAAGEAAVLENTPNAVILRPSVVFGPEDKFFNRFAAMARLMPALPLIGGGKTKLQPVHVADVAEAIVRAATEKQLALGQVDQFDSPTGKGATGIRTFSKSASVSGRIEDSARRVTGTVKDSNPRDGLDIVTVLTSTAETTRSKGVSAGTVISAGSK